MNGNVLPEFQEFLLAHYLVDKKYISFYAFWASKFLDDLMTEYSKYEHSQPSILNKAFNGEL